MMKTSSIYKALLFTAAFTSASMASATILAQYDFNSAATPFADVVNASNVTAGDITLGTQMDLDDGRSITSTAEGAGSFFGRGTSISTGLGTTSAAFAFAQTEGIYLELTLTPDVGTTLNLTSLQLDAGYTGTNLFRLAVTSSLTGHDYGDQLTISTENTDDKNSIANILQSDQNGMSSVPAGVGGDWGAAANTLIDLSGSTFDNLSSAVTFRIYGFMLSTADTDDILRLDNIQVMGSVIPEPSSLALLLGSLTLFILLVKRRK